MLYIGSTLVVASRDELNTDSPIHPIHPMDDVTD